MYEVQLLPPFGFDLTPDYVQFRPLSLIPYSILVINIDNKMLIMGRLIPPFRQLYQETISDLQMELQAALADLGHKNAFDLLLKEAWNPEQAAMGNSTLPLVCDKLNIMAAIHTRKLIAALLRELSQRNAIIDKLEERVVSLEDRLQQLKTAL